MGFNLPAFNAGYRTANKPVTEQIAIARITQFQGTTNPVLIAMDIRFPIKIPNMIPSIAPSTLIIIDSIRN